MPAWVSIVLAGFLTAAPQYVTLLPHTAQAGLTAVMAVAGGIYHLYSTVPGTVTGIKIP
jgi:hypothetical protein